MAIYPAGGAVHLWNPSNFGICALLLLAPDTFR